MLQQSDGPWFDSGSPDFFHQLHCTTHQRKMHPSLMLSPSHESHRSSYEFWVLCAFRMLLCGQHKLYDLTSIAPWKQHLRLAPTCGSWLYPVPDIFRSSRIYCSPARHHAGSPMNDWLDGNCSCDRGGHLLRGVIMSGVAQWLACWAHNPKVCGIETTLRYIFVALASRR